jgi:hypothetical protein
MKAHQLWRIDRAGHRSRGNIGLLCAFGWLVLPERTADSRVGAGQQTVALTNTSRHRECVIEKTASEGIDA